MFGPPHVNSMSGTPAIRNVQNHIKGHTTGVGSTPLLFDTPRQTYPAYVVPNLPQCVYCGSFRPSRPYRYISSFRLVRWEGGKKSASGSKVTPPFLLSVPWVTNYRLHHGTVGASDAIPRVYRRRAQSRR